MAKLTLKDRKPARLAANEVKAKADQRFEAGKLSGPQYERVIANANRALERK